jgi:hypothetical protein
MEPLPRAPPHQHLEKLSTANLEPALAEWRLGAVGRRDGGLACEWLFCKITFASLMLQATQGGGSLQDCGPLIPGNKGSQEADAKGL